VAYPQYVAELNSDSITTGIPKQVEVYPYPTESVTMRYTFWATPKMLNYDDYLPLAIDDPDILRTGAAIDAFSNRAGRVVRLGKPDEAA